jgi:hypothetical protein
METSPKTRPLRKTRHQWSRLVARWRRSGESAGAFAYAHGVLEGTLRWWAWKLGREAEQGGNVALIPVHVSGARQASGETATVWRVRTARGELVVRGPDAAARAQILDGIFGARS